MSLTYKDYYKILGVPREATKEQIRKAFRDLAKKYHPDKTKGDPKAETKFKEINEAHEVLGNEDRRKQYDRLGSGFSDGQPFTPPPDWAQMFSGRGRPGGATFEFRGGGDFTDLFDLLRGFGVSGGGGGRPGSSVFDEMFTQAGRGPGGPFGGPSTGADASHLESNLTISLEDAYRGGVKKVTLAMPGAGPGRRMGGAQKSYDVKIPAGIQDGQKIRLRGEGAGSGTGDLFLRIRIAPHPVYSFEGKHLVADVKVAPWEAALGSKIKVPTLDGSVEMKLPAGVRSGQKLRLAGKGYPIKEGGRGDLLLRVMIEVPQQLNAEERELFERLQRLSKFNPRAA
jgi:curved DNA-binding protein